MVGCNGCCLGVRCIAPNGLTLCAGVGTKVQKFSHLQKMKKPQKLNHLLSHTCAKRVLVAGLVFKERFLNN
jgi:hypothetical protein